MAIAVTDFPTADDVELLARIDAWVAVATTCPVARGDTGQPPVLDLEPSLHTADWWALTPQAEAHLDRLRKKIEVARRLCRYYLPDLSRAAAPAPLSATGAQRLCALLLRAAVLRRDARYLNSALKLLDGVLGRDDLAFPAELGALAHATLDALAPLVTRAA